MSTIMERELEDIIKEGKEFQELKRQHKYNKFPGAGSPGYLISRDWIKKYKKYIMYKQIKCSQKPTMEDGHCQKYHPGPITNETDICDMSDKYLRGTGLLAEFEPTVVDRYIKADCRERYNFKIYSEVIWNFLYSKYGGTEIKRYYIQMGQYYSQVELYFKQIPLYLLEVDTIYKQGQLIRNMLVEQRVQISKKKSYADLKKRIADCLSALHSTTISEDQVRLWKFNENKEKLVEACSNVQKKLTEEESSMQTSEIQEQQQKVDENLETNSGVQFPGESIEPLLTVQTTLEDDSLDDAGLVVEYKLSLESKFAFQFLKNQKVTIGKCEFCNQRKVLKVECLCKRVKYCNERCKDKDKSFHSGNCSALLDSELRQTNFNRSQNAKDGKVGLSNLGNTCYMNSSLQCLSNTWELTKYFLDKRFVNELNTQNPLGTEGRLVQAYAKLLNEMWNQDDSVVRPSTFKKLLGQYSQQFSGNGQHDSQECISAILDLLSEDLYRKEKKPYVEIKEADGKPDDIASKEAWANHLLRNDSIITDLFHGQYKSTLVCSICSKVSVTFDPFMTLIVPIPGKKEKFSFFYIPYDMNTKDYTNYRQEIFLRNSEHLLTFRETVAQKLNITPQDFIITKVTDNNITKMYSLQQQAEDLSGSGIILLYQINPQLNPILVPIEQQNKVDKNYGIDEEIWTKQVIYLQQYQKQQYSSFITCKLINIPRIMWIRKDWTLKQVHLEIFKFFKKIITNWYQMSNDTNSQKEIPKPHFKKPSIDEKDDKPLTFEEFEQMDINNQFQSVFPGLDEESWKTLCSKQDFLPTEMPYILKLKNITGYMEPCTFCDDKKCDGCPLPFSSTMVYKDLFKNIGVHTNQSFYSDDYSKKGRKDVIIELVFSKGIHKAIYESIQNAKPYKNPNDNSDGKEEAKEGQITLNDCLEEFKKSEMLDEDNKWYCPKCKEHVQATKRLEIYRTPPVLIISLKRFKAGKQKHYNMYSSGGGKLSTHVDFPIQNLDMCSFVLSSAQQNTKEPLIYDLFAISNHYGGTGGGHYTAYAMNWRDQQWYHFDDSSFQKTSTSRIVSDGAYNLFYRKRGFIDLNNIDYDMIKQSTQQQ